MSPYRETVILAPSDCPNLVTRDGDLGYPCGLEWGHDGDHTWYTPGDYLPPPLIHPLAFYDAGWLRGWQPRRCPLCGRSLWNAAAENTHVFYGSTDECRHELRYQFSPCGCEGRVTIDDV